MAFIVIRLRGFVDTQKRTVATLDMLHLTRNNSAVLLPENDYYKGMLNRSKDYITWGKATPESIAELIRKRGRLTGGAAITEDYIKKNTEYSSIEDLAKALYADRLNYKDLGKDVKPLFRLAPPVKGLKSIKRSYPAGGDLGFRGDAISALLARMI